MNSSFKAAQFALGLLALMPFAANAQNSDEGQGTGHTSDSNGNGHTSHGNGNGYGHTEDGGGTSSVPELDPNAAGAALTLLAGGAFLLTSRRRRAY